jgi:hypothetical protein
VSTQDAAARVAVLTALRDAIAEELGGAKEELSVALAALHKEHGTDRTSAVLPGGEKVATIAWVPSAVRFRVSDEAAFSEWVLANHPTEVRTVLTVRAVWQTVYLKDGLKAIGTSAVDRDTGEIVPGVEAFNSAEYARLTFANEGRGAVAAAWRQGKITTDFLALLPPVTEGEH